MRLRKIKVTDGGWAEKDCGLVNVNIEKFYFYQGQYFKISDIKKCVDSGFYIENSEDMGIDFYLNNKNEMAKLLEVCEEIDFYLDEKINYQEDLNNRLRTCVESNQIIVNNVLRKK